MNHFLYRSILNKKIHLVALLCCAYSLVCQSQLTLAYLNLKKTDTTFIEKISVIKAGQPIDLQLIQEEIQNLRRIPSVANVYIDWDSTTRQITYRFEENQTLIPELGVWTSVRQTAFQVGLTEHNLLGKNMALGGFYRNNGFHSMGLHFNAPFLFSHKWGVDAQLYQFVSEEPLFLDNQSFDYKYANSGVELGLLFRPHFNHRFRLAINPFRENYNFIGEENHPNLPDAAVLEKVLLKTFYEYNDLNFFYYLVDGWQLQFHAQEMISEENFRISLLDLSYFHQIKEKGNLAARLHLGISSNINSPFAPFALDNNINIRGVGNIIDRGTGVISLNLEYRHTLFEKRWFALQTNSFIDMGSWRQPGGNFQDFIDPDNTRYFAGVGLRFIHKFIFGAALRIDYGWNVEDFSEGGFVFGIGQYF